MGKKQQYVSPTFCVMPWINLSGEANGDFRLCCYDIYNEKEGALGNIQNIDIKALRDSDTMKKVRSSMLQGKKVSRCAECYKKEAIGADSNRVKMNEYYKRFIPDILSTTNPELGDTSFFYLYLDIRFSNICNLACRMCYSALSSSRKQLDEILYDGKSSKVHAGVWNTPKLFESKELLENLQIVYIAGGEPFLDPDQKRFVDTLVESGKSKEIEIFYNTNLTVINEELLSPLLHFNIVHIIISCDGYGDKYEYIRIGAKWDKLLKNIIFAKTFFRKHKYDADFCMNMVVQRDNVRDVLKLYIFVKKYFGFRFFVEVLVNPEYYSIAYLDEKEKHDLMTLYQYYFRKYKDMYPDIINDFQGVVNVISKSEFSQDIETDYKKITHTIDEYTRNL